MDRKHELGLGGTEPAFVDECGGFRLLELEFESCGGFLEHLFHNHRGTKSSLKVVTKKVKGSIELCDWRILHFFRENIQKILYNYIIKHLPVLPAAD